MTATITFTPVVGPLTMLGMNADGMDYWLNHSPLLELFHGSEWISDATGGWAVVPKADIGSDGYPHVLPAGASWVQRGLTTPPTTDNILVTWTGAIANFGCVNGGVVSGPTMVGNEGSAVISVPSGVIQGTLNGTIYVQYTIPDTANWPRNFSAKKVGATGVVDPVWLARMQEVTKPGGYIRPMDTTGVNGNMGIQGSLIGQSRPLTAANRAKPGRGQWLEGDFNSGHFGGLPIEMGVAMANAANRNLAWPLHWNGDQGYYEDVVDAVLRDVTADPYTSGLNSGLTIGFSLQNEVWNYQFSSTGQAEAESHDLQLMRRDGLSWASLPVRGDGSGHKQEMYSAEGYCYRFVQVMQWIIARWNAHARVSKPTMRRIFEWQNAAGDGWTVSLLDYAPQGANAPSLGGVTVKSIATDYWTAPYAACDNSVNTVDEALAALYADIPGVLANAKACADAAAARGVRYGTYEGGPHPNLSGKPTIENALRLDPRMYDFITYYMQQFRTVVGNYPFTYYSNHGRGQWGAMDYTYQTPTLANAPKHMALKALAAA